MSISLLSFPNLSQKSPLISIPKNTLQTKYPTSPHRIQSWRAHPPCDISGVWVKPLRFLLPQRKLEFGFSSGAVNGEGEAESVVEEVDGGRGESTMPSRFRYLLKEAPDIPVRWPWLIALPFMIYAWRTVLWELSNWKNALLGISHFLGYLGKFVLAVVFHYIGDPVTSLIRCIETVLYTIRSIYSGIVASTPVPELSMIIMLTSVVLAIAETAVPNSVNSQPYLLTMAGVVGFIAVRGSIPEPFFWMILAGLFCYSRFVQKKNGVSSALPVAAVLSAVGALWVRLLVMSSYLALSICHHSKKLSEENTEVEIADVRRRVPLPLFGAGLAIGVHVAAKWLRFRHLTWMIA